MAKRKRFDLEAENTRNRVKRFRDLKKMKLIYEKKVCENISSNPSIQKQFFEFENNFDDSRTQADSISDHVLKVDKALEIKDKLIRWAIGHRITKIATDELLSILKLSGLSFLPKDSRTLLGTPVNIPITPLSNGKIWYNGVEACLKNIFSGISNDVSVTLDYNFDGAPISKSSNSQIWPILSSIRGK